MVVKSTQKNVGKVAAVLGGFQGLIYSALSLTCIVLYNKSHTVELPNNQTNYNSLLQHLMFHQYISDPLFATQAVIRPFDFTIFMWVYYFLSIGWLVASLDLFAAIYYNKRRQSLLMVIWATITGIICVVDLVLTSLLARDYESCSEETSHFYDCHLTVGIVMTVAARGYTLWIVNFIFACILMSTAKKIMKEDTGTYDQYRIPRAKIPPSNNSLERPANQWTENIYYTSNSSEPRQQPSFVDRPNNFF